jgi:hypothetical protein
MVVRGAECSRRHDVAPAPVPSPDRLTHLKQQPKPITEDKTTHLVARHLQVFGTVRKPLPTSFNRGMRLEAIVALLGHTRKWK